jgi:sulfite exporter TauE/SafE
VNETSLIAALVMGLLGSSHCLFMCGGIGAALGMGTAERRRYPTLLLFQLGRLGSYTVLGAGLGAVVQLLKGDSMLFMAIPRLLSAVLLIAMGCYVSSWWQGLLVLEKAGQVIWRRVQPLTRNLLPVRRYRDAVIIGLCWGLLPCGLIYTALVWSATSGSSAMAASLMFCFGLGTLPAMLLTGVAGEKLGQLLRQQNLRNTAAVLLIIFGIWTAWGVVGHLVQGGHQGEGGSGNAGDSPHSQHQHH